MPTAQTNKAKIIRHLEHEGARRLQVGLEARHHHSASPLHLSPVVARSIATEILNVASAG
jgi:hypothetical protein